MAVKVIVLGSINGKLESAFQKLSTLHAKNHFAFAIVTGNLFGGQEDESTLQRLLNGGFTVPVSTYFTIGDAPLPPLVIERIEEGEDICENLHYLGKRSITKTSDGVRIVTLGGVLDRSIVGGQSKEQHLPFHTPSDAAALRGANTADILLTSIWPAGVWNNSKTTLTSESRALIASSDEVAELCATLKPRYHFTFSPSDFFYEREPFFFPASEDEPDKKMITRFISMGPFGNPAKAKAMYAFNLQVGETSSEVPAGSTISPFLPQTRSKRRADADTEGYTGRFGSGDSHGDSHHRRKRRRSPPPGPDQCFFCLSNANLETHMVCSIGDYSYLAAAKGPLPNNHLFASENIDFPCHQIIVPFAHEPTMQAIPSEGPETYKEMSRFRESLQAMVATQSKHKLGAVTWEISRAKNIHLHWQFLPVPAELIRKGLVEAGFKVEAENLKYPAFAEQDIGAGTNESGDYLRLWLWTDDGDTSIQSKELVMLIDDSFRFDLQFPRKVVAKLLRLDRRIRWQDVVQSKEEETEDAERFKEAFKKWDFTLAQA